MLLEAYHWIRGHLPYWRAALLQLALLLPLLLPPLLPPPLPLPPARLMPARAPGTPLCLTAATRVRTDGAPRMPVPCSHHCCACGLTAVLCRDRRGGRDHIWLVTHDEASCYVPAAIRPSIILSHWCGRRERRPALRCAVLYGAACRLVARAAPPFPSC